MSVRCISQVLDKSTHSGSELLMLIVLADYSDDFGNSYPGVSALARKCRMKPRNANYVLKALQDSGELRVLRNEGPKGTNRYRIMLERLGTAKPLQPIALLQSIAPLQHSASTPATQCSKPLQSTAPKPSLNRQEPSSGFPTGNSVDQKRSRPNKKQLVLDDFEEFYKAYPKKVAKTAAAKAFKAEKLDGMLTLLLTDINNRISNGDWKLDQKQYIPNPATYLNNRRWEDEPAGISGPSKTAWDGSR